MNTNEKDQGPGGIRIAGQSLATLLKVLDDLGIDPSEATICGELQIELP
jgi:hypothetical protein